MQHLKTVQFQVRQYFMCYSFIYDPKILCITQHCCRINIVLLKRLYVRSCINDIIIITVNPFTTDTSK